jgi:eukaryotic-like serine/threonine-protein kinase
MDIPDLTGQAMGPFRLVEKLGSGGFGAVYKGVHHVLGHSRAVKVMLLPDDLTERDRYIRLSNREARLAARLRHENIVQIEDVGQRDNFHYIVMELLDGQALYDLV